MSQPLGCLELGWIWQGLTWIWQSSFQLRAVPSQQIRCQVTSGQSRDKVCIVCYGWCREIRVCALPGGSAGVWICLLGQGTWARRRRKSLLPLLFFLWVSKSRLCFVSLDLLSATSNCHLPQGGGDLAWRWGWRPKLSAGLRRLKGRRFKPLASFKHKLLRLVKVRAGLNYAQTRRFFRMTALGAVCSRGPSGHRPRPPSVPSSGGSEFCAGSQGQREHSRDPWRAPAWAQLVGAEPGAAAGSPQRGPGSPWSRITLGRMGSLRSWVHEWYHMGFGLREITLGRAQVGICGCPLCEAPGVLLLVQGSQSHRGWKGPSGSSSATKALPGQGRQQWDLEVPVPKGSS